MPWTLSNSLGLFHIYILFQIDFMTYWSWKLDVWTLQVFSIYGTGHMQYRTRRLTPASMHTKWVSHRMTLLACLLTRACVLLSFTRALARRVIKNLLKHHKSFTMAILCKGPATINLVDMITNHSRLLQESWPDSSSDSYLPNKDCNEILQASTKIYRNKWLIPDSRITLVSLVEYTSFLEPLTWFGIVAGPSPSYGH